MIVINNSGNILFYPLTILWKNGRNAILSYQNKMSVEIVIFNFHNDLLEGKVFSFVIFCY